MWSRCLNVINFALIFVRINALQTHRKMLGGALGLATANHKQLLNPNSPIDLEAWRDALLQSTKNQVRHKHHFNSEKCIVWHTDTYNDVCYP